MYASVSESPIPTIHFFTIQYLHVYTMYMYIGQEATPHNYFFTYMYVCMYKYIYMYIFIDFFSAFCLLSMYIHITHQCFIQDIHVYMYFVGGNQSLVTCVEYTASRGVWVVLNLGPLRLLLGPHKAGS